MPGNCSRNQPTKMDRKWRGEGKGSMGGERWHSRVGIPSFAGGGGRGGVWGGKQGSFSKAIELERPLEAT